MEQLIASSGTAKLAVTRHGSGQPLVFLHAGVADRRSWHPLIDALSKKMGGIQSIELRVPLGSYLPWQLRTVPPTDRLVSFQGTFVPLQRVEADRRRIGDRRPSLERTYRSREVFLTAVDGATRTLVSQRFLLPEDRRVARDRMERTWDWVNQH